MRNVEAGAGLCHGNLSQTLITATTLIAAQMKFAGLALTLGDIEIALRIIKLGLAVKTFGDQFFG